MLRHLLLASAILGLLQAQTPCPTSQYSALISDLSNFTPVQGVLSVVLQQETLANVITVETTYEVQDIVLKPELFEEDISVQLLDNQLTIEVSVPYITDFQVKQAEQLIGDGSGFLTSSTLTIVAETTDYQTWTLKVYLTHLIQYSQSITGDYSGVQFIELNFSHLLTVDQYHELQNALISGDNSIPSQLQTLYASEYYTTQLQNAINAWMTEFLAESYEYTYMNINKEEQKVTLLTTASQFTFNGQNMTLSLERNMGVSGYAGQTCGTLSEAAVNGTQVEEFTWESMVSVFNYAQSQKYFDTSLGAAWNSPYFQFDAASLWNVLAGIEGNFYPYDQASGQCTASDANLANTNGTISVQVSYDCSLDQINSQGGEPLISVSFDLGMGVKVRQGVSLFELGSQNESSEFVFVGQNPQLSNVAFTENPSYTLTDEALATLYLQTVVLSAFHGQQLFGKGVSALFQGSGVPTLTRRSTTTSWEGTNVVVYQQ